MTELESLKKRRDEIDEMIRNIKEKELRDKIDKMMVDNPDYIVRIGILNPSDNRYDLLFYTISAKRVKILIDT